MPYTSMASIELLYANSDMLNIKCLQNMFGTDFWIVLKENRLEQLIAK